MEGDGWCSLEVSQFFVACLFLARLWGEVVPLDSKVRCMCAC